MIEVTEVPTTLEKAKHYAKEHMNTEAPWIHGELHNCWIDDSGILCIQYEDGCWWRYRMEGGRLKWS